MNKSIKDWYLRIRPFELKNKGDVYALLGARFYKKWVPTSGEVITRLRGIDRLKLVKTGSRRKALKNHEDQTKAWEWRHLISAMFLYVWAVGAGFVIGVEHFYISVVLNMFINIYPIFVQRYNRIRIQLLLGKLDP